MSDTRQLKHLDFIQLTITRMAANSFLLKAWAVTLVAALLALAAGRANRTFLLISILPLAAFWILDGYYLHQERLYRKMYDKVRTTAEGDIDFSMNPVPFKAGTPSWFDSIFAQTLTIFYGVILIALAIITWSLG